jgi:hypothetical protein
MSHVGAISLLICGYDCGTLKVLIRAQRMNGASYSKTATRLHVGSVRSIAVVLAALAASTIVGGCGQSSEQVIVRVGRSTITKASLEHWTSVMAPRQGAPVPPRFTACIAHLHELAIRGGQFKEACRHQYSELRQSALQFLIATNWLIGEAADRGIHVSDREIDHRLSEQYGSTEGGFQFKALLVGGHTPSDIRLETQSELAAKKLRQQLTVYANDIPGGRIASYYKHNLRRFYLRERRYVELIGNLKGLARVREIFRMIGRGASFVSLSFRVWLERPNFGSIEKEKRILEKAIFRARPDVVVGPLLIGGYYFLFRVAEIRPGGVQPLVAATGRVKQELSAKRRVRFVEGWRSKWTAETICAPKYVVQKCRHYHGPMAPEDPLDVN